MKHERKILRRLLWARERMDELGYDDTIGYLETAIHEFVGWAVARGEDPR